MSNLIFIYNGHAPDFSNEINRIKFGPCYSIFQHINDVASMQHRSFAVINVSARTNYDCFPYGASPERNADVNAWIEASQAGIIKIPIIIVDICMLYPIKKQQSGDSNYYFYQPQTCILYPRLIVDKHNIIGGHNIVDERNLNAIAEVARILPDSLMQNLLSWFQRGVLAPGDHVIKAITAKDAFAFFVRYVFGGLVCDSSVVPHRFLPDRNYQNMADQEIESYPFLGLEEIDDNTVRSIVSFLDSLNGEMRRSGAPAVLYSNGGRILSIFWGNLSSMLSPDMRAELSNVIPPNKNVFFRPLAMVEPHLDLRTMVHFKNLCGVDVFFNYAPMKFEGTLCALIMFLACATTVPRGLLLKEYSQAYSGFLLEITSIEHGWHYTDCSLICTNLFPLPHTPMQVYFLADGLYFPTLTMSFGDGRGLHIMFRSNGSPIGLVKIVSQMWSRGTETDPNPPVTPR